MYQYEFERISTDITGWGMLGGIELGTEDYRDIIVQRAEAGWRYVGFIPASQRADGYMRELDLVFEREI